jgi:hypothetical protein
MTTRDPLIDELVKTKKPVLIAKKWYLIESNNRGTCDGCVFFEENKNCPTRAVNICTSNGGNIFKELENGR